MNPRSLALRLVQAAALAASLVFTSLPVYPQAPDAPIVGVYPAQDRQDKAALYAVVQQLPPPPENMDVPQEWRSGVPLRVMITAAPSGVTTTERRRAGDAPCMRCTAQHFFIVPEDIPEGRYRELSALRHAPGPVTYVSLREGQGVRPVPYTGSADGGGLKARQRRADAHRLHASLLEGADKASFRGAAPRRFSKG